MEQVFVAWGKNMKLAQRVAELLPKKEVTSVLGGGLQREQGLWEQIRNQIADSTYAILLVQKTSNGNELFSDNLMYEWGYLCAHLNSASIKVYLIDTHQTDLPTDVANVITTHISTITPDGSIKDIDTVAKEIVDSFLTDIAKIPIMDKLEIATNYNLVKSRLNNYPNKPIYSEREACHYVLHTIQTCVFYSDYQDIYPLYQKLGDYAVKRKLNMLSKCVNLGLNLYKLYLNTNYLYTHLPAEHFFELETFFSQEIENDIPDQDIAVWYKIIRLHKFGLCYYYFGLGLNDTLSFEESRKCNEVALNCLNNDINDDDAAYSCMYRAVIVRHLLLVERELNGDNVAQLEKDVLDVRKKLMNEWGNKDENLAIIWQQMYYLSVLENFDSITDERKKLSLKLSIKSFIERCDRMYNHLAILNRIKEKYKQYYGG